MGRTASVRTGRLPRIEMTRPLAAASALIGSIAELGALGFPRGEGCPRAIRDQPPFLFCERGVQVQHKRVGVRAELGNDKWHALGHQAGNEGNVARKPIELGNEHRAFRLTRCGQRCGELRPPIEGVRALAGLDLSELVTSEMPSASAKRATAARCASMPSLIGPVAVSRPCSRQPRSSFPRLSARVFRLQTTVCSLLHKEARANNPR